MSVTMRDLVWWRANTETGESWWTEAVSTTEDCGADWGRDGPADQSPDAARDDYDLQGSFCYVNPNLGPGQYSVTAYDAYEYRRATDAEREYAVRACMTAEAAPYFLLWPEVQAEDCYCEPSPCLRWFMEPRPAHSQKPQDGIGGPWSPEAAV